MTTTRKRQSGLTMTEFAVVATVVLIVLLAVLDVARWYYTASAINEGTRRGARMAAVCPVNDPAIARAAVFGNPGGGQQSPLINGLGTQHINVQYLDRDGDPVADPGGAGFGSIRYVRVSLTGGFQIQTVIPGVSAIALRPDFAATLPRESLGIPRTGAVVAC